MVTVPVQLDEDLAALAARLEEPLDQALRKLIVLELYRREEISSGRAAELLGMERVDFINYASQLGIPYIEMDEDGWQAEVAQSREL